MTLDRRGLLGAALVAGAGLIAPAPLANPVLRAASPPPPSGPGNAAQPLALRRALAALERHSGRIAERDRIGLADFAQHSGEMRFMLVDVAAGRIEKSYFVSHGRGSDPRNSGFVQRFSNRHGSHASSRGSFLTGDAYVGKHGRSRRLHGLEEDNDNAFARAIVVHGADYVDSDMARRHGRVGRSLGCFAFERSQIGEILERLGPGRLLFVAD
ncbi:murein L,D-transpeptidase catalytic domain family protein [Erythrobacter sp.]|uniref:murein L,D-transpeptidase catalytic domain family protein n=1 Tax=Erythrobacter sp. TaxID=1042 RepID=UPI001425FB75|nr:murein L,D-transpeptidase catalytic domain family protein [Erythrobacter sp.]QIQ86363.1 MAG: murein L,D-transpeptidase catalytic domain family protein [Erythrobacter sp.]